MDTTYRVKPLGWRLMNSTPEGEESWHATCVLGSFCVNREFDNYGPLCTWKYCFNEYYDEATHECKSIEEGKRLAEAFYLDRLLPALEEVTP